MEVTNYMATMYYDNAVAVVRAGDVRVIELRGPARVEVDDDGTVSVITARDTYTLEPVRSGLAA